MLVTNELPPESVMLEAFLQRDPTYDGVFVTGVHTTGIFCRPTCPAKKPLPRNLSFFGSPREALLSGYRPCRRHTLLARIRALPSRDRCVVTRASRSAFCRFFIEDVDEYTGNQRCYK